MNPESGTMLKEFFVKHSANFKYIDKEHIIEYVFEIIDESTLIGIFSSEAEIQSIANYASLVYGKLSNSLEEKLLTHKADQLTPVMESSSAVISAFETIFIKYIQQAGTVDNIIMNSVKPFISFIIIQISANISHEDLLISVKYNGMLVSIFSRLMVFNPQHMFLIMHNSNINMPQLLQGWIGKMDNIGNIYGDRKSVV